MCFNLKLMILLLVVSLCLLLPSSGLVVESKSLANNDSTLRYELKFQTDFDNSSIHKRQNQQQIFKCQVRLAPIGSSLGSNKIRPNLKWSHQYIPSVDLNHLTSNPADRWPFNVSIDINWLHDNQQLSNATKGEPIAMYKVELHSGNIVKLDKKNKTRLEIKNTSNGGQLKLTSRLKISHLKPTDSGQYKCLARASFLVPSLKPFELLQIQQTLESNTVHLLVVSRANGSIPRLALDSSTQLEPYNSHDSHDNNSKATISGRGPHADRKNVSAAINVEPTFGSKLDDQRTKWQGTTQASDENIFEDDEDLFKIVQQDKNRLISGLKEQLQINEDGDNGVGGGDESGFSSFAEEENEKRQLMSNEVVAEEFLSVSSDSLDRLTPNESVTKPINNDYTSSMSSGIGDGAAAGPKRVTVVANSNSNSSGSQRDEITLSDNYFLTASLLSTRLELVKLVHKIAKLSCYTGLGEHYHGNVSISADLRPCFSWLLFKHSQHLINSSLTRLQDDKNHCRNPNLDPRGPWCFVKYIEQLDGTRASGTQRFALTASSVSQSGVRFIGRPCAISPCSRYLWLYIVAPPLGLLLVISCLMMLIVRSIRRARYNTVFAANVNSGQLSKFHQFFLASDRYPSKRFFGSGDKNRRDKYSDEDTFEIVDDLDWSDAQTHSLSPKSSQSLKLDSSFSSTGSQNGNCDSKHKLSTSNFTNTVLNPKALDQFHRGSGIIHSDDTRLSKKVKSIEPMFATLRCMVRNTTSKEHNNEPMALNNRANIINKCSTFSDQSTTTSPLRANMKDDSGLRKIELNSPNSLSSSISTGRMLHKSPSSSHLISYSNTTEDINSMSLNSGKTRKISDLPKLNASEISIAVDKQPIFEGMFNQVRYAFVNLSQKKSNITERIGSQVAVCSLKANAIHDLPNFDMSEAKLHHLNHLNILKLVGYFESDDDLTHGKLCTSLVYDMSHLVDLSDWLKQQSQTTVTCEEPGHDPEIRRNLSCFAKQISLAMDYLHDMDITYKDLACRNCFLDPSKMLIKLASFNIEPILSGTDEKIQNLKSMIRPKYLLDYYVIDTRPSNSQLLPLSWVPLETILFNKFNKQTDVWSLGCLIYELFSLGEVAFFGYSSKQIIDGVRSNAMPPQPLLCPNGIYRLMCKCLSDIPSMRPDIKQIYEHLNLYSGQCSSFLDHHLCSLDTSMLSQPACDRKFSVGTRIKNNNGSITKTKSHANLKCQSSQQTTESSVNYDTPLPLSFSRPEVVKIPLSKSINLTGSRMLPADRAGGHTIGQQNSVDVNQYDEPLIVDSVKWRSYEATSREGDRGQRM